jgi:hypothetical protein
LTTPAQQMHSTPRKVKVLRQPRNQAPCTAGTMRLISPPVVHMATGFGDLTNECESCLLICRRLRIRKTVFMAVVRGRPSGLPVTRFRFANLRTAATPFRLATICWQSQQTKRGFNYG